MFKYDFNFLYVIIILNIENQNLTISSDLNLSQFNKIKHFHFENFDFGVINFRKSFVIHRAMKSMEIKYKPDVVISTTGPTYFHSKSPQIIGFNLPLYIYPESPYVKAFTGMRKLKFAIKKRLHYYFFKRDASALVTQTDDVNQRVRKELGFDKVYTVTNTASAYYNQPDSFPNKLKPKPDWLFRLVTISAYYQHKNLELIGEVSRVLEQRGRTNFEFVLTIKPEPTLTLSLIFLPFT